MTTIEPAKTPKGVRYDLVIYVYPDGHGNITSPALGINVPVASLDEAATVLTKLWEEGQAKA